MRSRVSIPTYTLEDNSFVIAVNDVGTAYTQ
jgi:predicted RNase H-like HicB family nuclease